MRLICLILVVRSVVNARFLGKKAVLFSLSMSDCEFMFHIIITKLNLFPNDQFQSFLVLTSSNLVDLQQQTSKLIVLVFVVTEAAFGPWIFHTKC